MARKTKEEAAQTKIQLLDAALLVFSENGYSGTSLQQIAERAGYTRGAVYWHFKNKIEVLLALADEVENRSDQLGLLDVHSVEDLTETLSSYLQRFECDTSFGLFYRTIMIQTGWTDEVELLAQWYRRDQRDFLDWLEGNFNKLQNQGLVTNDQSAAALALSTAAFCGGLVSLWLVDPQSIDMNKTAPQLLAHFLQRLNP